MIPRATVVIPARLQATRLPNKVLLSQTGRPLIEYAVRQARRCQFAASVVVATDSLRVAEAVSGMAVCWVDAGDESWCGTQRAARALVKLPQRYADADIIVNWQADEPEVDSSTVDQLICDAYAHRASYEFLTVVAPYSKGACKEPTITKAIAGGKLPNIRDFARTASEHQNNRPHVGIYAMTPDRLAELVSLPPSTRSIAESLEQLTWIDHGWRCRAVQIDYTPQGINTQADYDRFCGRHPHDD